MSSEKQEKYYLGVFYKNIFLAVVAQFKYFNNLEKNPSTYRWTNDLEIAEIFWLYKCAANDQNQYRIENMKFFYNNHSAGTTDLLSDDYDKKNGRLVAFLRPNFHNICTDQLSFKYLSNDDIRLLKIKDII